jgi:beta-glucosidase
LPQALEDEGGCRVRTIVDAFLEYADLVSRYLGDRVKMWGTLNEPYVFAKMGHLYGSHAPGSRDRKLAFNAAHHLLLSHGHAVPIIRANSQEAQVGIVVNLWPKMPASQSKVDLAKRKLFRVLMLNPINCPGFLYEVR